MNHRLPAWMLWFFLAAFGATSGQAAVDARNSNSRIFSAPVAVSIDPYAALEEILRSNGGELHRYVMKFGIPPELASHFQGAFGEETFRIMDDETYGMVLEDPENPGKPMNITFAMHDGEAPPVESETDYNKRMTELQDASFLKGFTWGVGYGGIDLITSTGKAIAGTAKFVGRGVLQVALRVRWTAQWMTGGNTAATQEMIVEVDSAQAAVIREKLQIAKFLGKLLIESAGVLGKIEVGLITGDMELVETALHGSETHRKIFEMCAEVMTQTMKDYGETGSLRQDKHR